MNNPFFSFPRLLTKRLVLRQPSMDDAAHLFKYRSHPEFLPVPRVSSFTQELEAQAHIFNRLNKFYNQEVITWIISLPIDLHCIGSVSLIAFPRDSFCNSHRLEISSEISPDFRRNGFVTEAKREIIKWAFESNKSLLRIHSEITSSNTASIRVNEKLGFKNEGCLRNFEREHGKIADIVIMSFTREDYEAQQCDSPNASPRHAFC